MAWEGHEQKYIVKYTFPFFVMRKFGELPSAFLRRVALTMTDEPMHVIYQTTLEMFKLHLHWSAQADDGNAQNCECSCYGAYLAADVSQYGQ